MRIGILRDGGTVDENVFLDVLRSTDPGPSLAASIPVSLEERAIEQARGVGRARLAKARQRQRTQPYGDPGDAVRQEIDEWSCIAESGVARYLGLAWNSEIVEDLSEKPPDVGETIDVKWTQYSNGHLITHDDDIDERYFVLVCGKLPKMMIVGWLQGYETKEKGLRDHPRARNEGDYWTPQAELAPIGQLKGLVMRKQVT